MPKKTKPTKAKSLGKSAAKGAPKKVALKTMAAPKPAAKPAPLKKVAAKPILKPSLKSEPKKDVKHPATQRAGVMMSKVSDAGKGKKGVELKVKAAAPAAPVSPALTKPQKLPKVKKVAAPKNYDDMCREIACESSSSTSGYCRLHYIKNWKKIKRKELILREKKLNQYIEELVSKYPDKYIEAIKQDLADETAFSKVIYDLELDEGVDDIPVEDDADEQVIDSIKREFDDGDTDF